MTWHITYYINLVEVTTGNWVNAIPVHLIRKSLLSFKLPTTDPLEKSCFPNWFTLLYMVMEEILSSTFFTEWTSTGYCEASETFLVSSPRSLISLRFPHFSPMNTILGKSSKFSLSSISTQLSSSWTIAAFSEGLSSSMKPWFLFWN